MVGNMFLLDTNILIEMFHGRPGLRARIASQGLEKCFVSELSLGELYVGAYKTGRNEYFRQIGFIKQNFKVIPFDGPAEDYGRIRAGLEQAGTPIGEMDLLLAATAVNRGLTLVTHNVRHFSRIPGLSVEDWFGA